AHDRRGVVELVDARGQVGDEQAGQLLAAYPRRPVAVAVITRVMKPGRRDDVDPGFRGDLDQPADVAPRTGRHGVDHQRHAVCRALGYLGDRRVCVVQMDLRVAGFDERAVDDQVLVRVDRTGPDLGPVPANRPDEPGHSAGHSGTQSADGFGRSRAVAIRVQDFVT